MVYAIVAIFGFQFAEVKAERYKNEAQKAIDIRNEAIKTRASKVIKELLNEKGKQSKSKFGRDIYTAKWS